MVSKARQAAPNAQPAVAADGDDVPVANTVKVQREINKLRAKDHRISSIGPTRLARDGVDNIVGPKTMHAVEQVQELYAGNPDALKAFPQLQALVQHRAQTSMDPRLQAPEPRRPREAQARPSAGVPVQPNAAPPQPGPNAALPGLPNAAQPALPNAAPPQPGPNAAQPALPNAAQSAAAVTEPVAAAPAPVTQPVEQPGEATLDDKGHLKLPRGPFPAASVAQALSDKNSHYRNIRDLIGSQPPENLVALAHAAKGTPLFDKLVDRCTKDTRCPPAVMASFVNMKLTDTATAGAMVDQYVNANSGQAPAFADALRSQIGDSGFRQLPDSARASLSRAVHNRPETDKTRAALTAATGTPDGKLSPENLVAGGSVQALGGYLANASPAEARALKDAFVARLPKIGDDAPLTDAQKQMVNRLIQVAKWQGTKTSFAQMFSGEALKPEVLTAIVGQSSYPDVGVGFEPNPPAPVPDDATALAGVARNTVPTRADGTMIFDPKAQLDDNGIADIYDHLKAVQHRGTEAGSAYASDVDELVKSLPPYNLAQLSMLARSGNESVANSGVADALSDGIKRLVRDPDRAGQLFADYAALAATDAQYTPDAKAVVSALQASDTYFEWSSTRNDRRLKFVDALMKEARDIEGFDPNEAVKRLDEGVRGDIADALQSRPATDAARKLFEAADTRGGDNIGHFNAGRLHWLYTQATPEQIAALLKKDKSQIIKFVSASSDYVNKGARLSDEEREALGSRIVAAYNLLSDEQKAALTFAYSRNQGPDFLKNNLTKYGVTNPLPAVTVSGTPVVADAQPGVAAVPDEDPDLRRLREGVITVQDLAKVPGTDVDRSAALFWAARKQKAETAEQLAIALTQRSSYPRSDFAAAVVEGKSDEELRSLTPLTLSQLAYALEGTSRPMTGEPDVSPLEAGSKRRKAWERIEEALLVSNPKQALTDRRTAYYAGRVAPQQTVVPILSAADADTLEKWLGNVSGASDTPATAARFASIVGALQGDKASAVRDILVKWTKSDAVEWRRVGKRMLETLEQNVSHGWEPSQRQGSSGG